MLFRHGQIPMNIYLSMLTSCVFRCLLSVVVLSFSFYFVYFVLSLFFISLIAWIQTHDIVNKNWSFFFLLIFLSFHHWLFFFAFSELSVCICVYLYFSSVRLLTRIVAGALGVYINIAFLELTVLIMFLYAPSMFNANNIYYSIQCGNWRQSARSNLKLSFYDLNHMYKIDCQLRWKMQYMQWIFQNG